MSDDVKPALKPEEWAAFLSDGIGGSFSEIHLCLGRRLVFLEHHGIAAVSLHDQPFGFTWEHVEAVLWAVDRLTDHASPILGAAGTPLHLVRETADRIAALLPPRDNG